MLTEILDHAARAKARLLSQYRDKPKLAALVGALSDAVQALEVSLFDVLEQTALGVATGAWLDRLGAIVGESRSGASDADFRQYILARIKANRSHGTFEDVINVIEAWANLPFVTGEVTLVELGHASFQVDLSGEILAVPNDISETHLTRLARLLPRTRAAGVGSQLLWSPDKDANLFTFATSASLEASAAQGFGDSSNAATGGKLRGVIIV